MEFKVFGYHARGELIVLCVVIGIILGSHLFCSCTSFSIGGMPSNVGSVIKETFTQQTMLGSDDYGAPLNYSMDTGLPVANWENAARNYAKQIGNQVGSVLQGRPHPPAPRRTPHFCRQRGQARVLPQLLLVQHRLHLHQPKAVGLFEPARRKPHAEHRVLRKC